MHTQKMHQYKSPPIDDAPRVLSIHHMPPKLSSINESRRLLQILATSFSPKMLSKNEEERKMGEMGEI
jgi:hypothetical protein